MPAFKRCICINVLGAEILVDLRYMGYIISLNNTSLLIKCLDQVDSGALNVGVSFQRNHKKKLYVAWLFFFPVILIPPCSRVVEHNRHQNCSALLPLTWITQTCQPAVFSKYTVMYGHTLEPWIKWAVETQQVVLVTVLKSESATGL